MPDVRRISVKFDSDTKNLSKGFGQIQKKTQKLRRTLIKLGAALGVAFSGRALIRGFNTTVKSLDALNKTAKGVGFTANEYERLTFALSQVGVEAGSAKIAIGDFQKRLSKSVAGTSPAFAKAFREAGLDVKALSNLSPAAAFDAAFAHLSTQLDDPRIAGFFGNVFEEQSGKDMLKAARQLEGLTRARADYDRLVAGSTTLKQDAAAVEEFTYQTTLLDLQWELFKREVVIKTLPALQTLLERLGASTAFDNLTASLSKFVTTLAEAVALLDRLTEGAHAAGLDPGAKTAAKGVLQGDVEKAAHKRARKARERFLRTDPMSGKARPTIGQSGLSEIHIQQVFNGVKEKDMPSKAGRAAGDAVAREVQ